MHVNEYPNQPWSLTKLKPIWHREVPIGGNGQTPCVSKYMMNRVEENKIFKSTHTANFKQVVSFGPTSAEDVTMMSIDTGMSGNLLAGNYFDMNHNHLYGRLLPMTLNDFKTLLSNEQNYVLKLHPLSTKKKRVIRPLEDQLVDEQFAKDEQKKRAERFKEYTSDDEDDVNALLAKDDKKAHSLDPDPTGLINHYKDKDEEVIRRREKKEQAGSSNSRQEDL